MIASEAPATLRVASISNRTRIVPNAMSVVVGSIARKMPGFVNSTAAYPVTTTPSTAATQRAIRSTRPDPGRVGVIRYSSASANARCTERWIIGEKFTVTAVYSWNTAIASAIAFATAPAMRCARVGSTGTGNVSDTASACSCYGRACRTRHRATRAAAASVAFGRGVNRS
jgi:hypothetical protein